MAETLDAALEALRRDDFYRAMADAENDLRNDSGADDFRSERERWMLADLG